MSMWRYWHWSGGYRDYSPSWRLLVYFHVAGMPGSSQTPLKFTAAQELYKVAGHLLCQMQAGFQRSELCSWKKMKRRKQNKLISIANEPFSMSAGDIKKHDTITTNAGNKALSSLPYSKTHSASRSLRKTALTASMPNDGFSFWDPSWFSVWRRDRISFNWWAKNTPGPTPHPSLLCIITFITYLRWSLGWWF